MRVIIRIAVLLFSLGAVPALAGAAPSRPAAISADEVADYEVREKQARGLEDFEGGRRGGGAIPITTVIVILLVVILVVIIV